MPGFDRSGPMGAGSMTGGRRGLCNPANANMGIPFAGRYGYGRGMGRTYGFRGGYGTGRGIRKGFCRGFGWYPPVYESMFPTNQTSEINMLKAEADSMKNVLEAINQRIAELEKSSEQFYRSQL